MRATTGRSSPPSSPTRSVSNSSPTPTSNAHDLSNWDITPLDGGRHLVVAPDLERWFASPGGTDEDGYTLIAPLPDAPELIAQARADFGDMILTTETIVEHNLWQR